MFLDIVRNPYHLLLPFFCYSIFIYNRFVALFVALRSDLKHVRRPFATGRVNPLDGSDRFYWVEVLEFLRNLQSRYYVQFSEWLFYYTVCFWSGDRERSQTRGLKVPWKLQNIVPKPRRQCLRRHSASSEFGAQSTSSFAYLFRVKDKVSVF